MIPELERLVKLQQIESLAAESQKRAAEAPAAVAALDATLASARDALAAAKQAVADNQTHRRALERDLLAAQQRLGKYKEQLMAVKTNEEYHAMQHQIAAAEAEVARIEELVIVNLVEADDVNARQKAAEAALKSEEARVARERAAVEAGAEESRRVLEQAARDREALVAQIDRAHLALFERVRDARQGVAVARAVDGHCSICHVRLRPQVYNSVIRNDAIIQCDSCQRILYYAGAREASAAGQAAIDAAESRQRAFERPEERRT